MPKHIALLFFPDMIPPVMYITEGYDLDGSPATTDTLSRAKKFDDVYQAEYPLSNYIGNVRKDYPNVQGHTFRV